MVNRIWHYHFGRGLVSTTSDFGVRGTAPTNPELLDWMAARFMKEGWSIKAMHRLILLSETYQLASTNVPANAAVDPTNLLHWRQNRQRLDAEEISDSVRLISGGLDMTPGERHPFPHELTYFYRQHEPFSELYPNAKRTVYAMQQRFQKNAYLDLFDGPDGVQHMPERRSTTTSLQSLFLMNSKFLHEQSSAIAEKLIAQAGPKIDDRVQWAYRNLFARTAQSAEIEKAQEFLTVLKNEHRTAGCTEAAVCEQRAWAGYVRAMLSSNAFLFVE
jgi:hypothetical protein